MKKKIIWNIWIYARVNIFFFKKVNKYIVICGLNVCTENGKKKLYINSNINNKRICVRMDGVW